MFSSKLGRVSVLVCLDENFVVQIEPVLEAMESVMARLALTLEGRVYVALCRGLWDLTAKEVFEYVEGLQEGRENKVEFSTIYWNLRVFCCLVGVSSSWGEDALALKARGCPCKSPAIVILCCCAFPVFHIFEVPAHHALIPVAKGPAGCGALFIYWPSQIPSAIVLNRLMTTAHHARLAAWVGSNPSFLIEGGVAWCSRGHGGAGRMLHLR